MNPNDQNQFTLNPKYYQINHPNFINFLRNTPDENQKNNERNIIDEKINLLERELQIQREINGKLLQKISDLEHILSKNNKTKDHQRVFSIPINSTLNHSVSLNTLSSQAILNSFLNNYPDNKSKRPQFLSKFIEDLHSKNKQTTEDKKPTKRLHHQKSNSFNTKSLVIVETTNHEQKTDFTTIHVNIQEGSVKSRPADNKPHLFTQKRKSPVNPIKKNVQKPIYEPRKSLPKGESNSNSTNLSVSVSNVSGLSSNKSIIMDKKQNKEETKEKNQHSFINSEKSVEFPSENESINLQKSNIANCQILLPPKLRQKIAYNTKNCIQRKWTCETTKNNTEENKKVDMESSKNWKEIDEKEGFIRSKTENNFFKDLSHSNSSKPHLYRQGADLVFNTVKKHFTPKISLRGHLDGVRSLFFTGNDILVSGSDDRTLKLWDSRDFGRIDSKKLEPYFTLREHKGEILSMTGNIDSNQKNDNNIFFSSDSKGIIKIFNLPSNEEFMLKGHMSDNDNNYILKSWQAHNDSIWNMHYRETENTLYSGGSDGIIKKWSIFEDNEINIKKINEFAYYEKDKNVFIPSSFSCIKDRIIASYISYDNMVIFDDKERFNTIKEKIFYKSDLINDQINKILFENTTKRIITAHEDKKIRVFDINSRKMIECFVAHKDSVTTLSQKNDSFYMASGGHDGSLRIWDLRNYKCIQEISAHRRKFDESIHCVLYNKDKDWLVSSGADGLIKVFKTDYN